MVLDPIPQSLPVHFFGSRPQPPTSLLIYVLCIARRYHQSLCVLDEDMHLACPMSRMSHLSTNETSTWQMRHEHCLMGHTSCVCHVCVCLMGTYKGVWRACRCSMEENDIFTCVRRSLRADDTHTNSLSLSLTHTYTHLHTHTLTLTLTHTQTHTHGIYRPCKLFSHSRFLARSRSCSRTCAHFLPLYVYAYTFCLYDIEHGIVHEFNFDTLHIHNLPPCVYVYTYILCMHRI